MTKQEIIREGVARKIHTQGGIWPKIHGTSDPCNCSWDELSDYFREIYLESASSLLDYLRSQGMDKMYQSAYDKGWTECREYYNIVEIK